jgi:hypothetical protein
VRGFYYSEAFGIVLLDQLPENRSLFGGFPDEWGKFMDGFLIARDSGGLQPTFDL